MPWGWLFCCLGGPKRYLAATTAAVAAGIGIMLFLSLKRLADRKRPCDIEPHSWAHLLPPDRFSFPSGHSITAFAVGVPLSLFYPGWMIGVLFCAFSVAGSRILLGMHFLSDVVVGGGSGRLARLLLLYVFCLITPNTRPMKAGIVVGVSS